MWSKYAEKTRGGAADADGGGGGGGVTSEPNGGGGVVTSEPNGGASIAEPGPTARGSIEGARHQPPPTGIVCCCQSAPCCFPDGCCPDGCCPDSMCPNGCLGEQFEGCCMCFGAAGGSGGCFSCGGCCFGGAVTEPPSVGVREMISKLADANADPTSVRATVRGAAIEAMEAAKAREKERKSHCNGANSSQAEREKKDSKAHRQEIQTLDKLRKDGMLTEKQYEARVNKVLGLDAHDMEPKDGFVYPLGGCCNNAPCCWPDGCCPDGCCPDGCCPNGMIGEQFKGCCIGAASKRAVPWYNSSAGKDADDQVFLAAVISLCNSEASNKHVFESLKALVADKAAEDA